MVHCVQMKEETLLMRVAAPDNLIFQQVCRTTRLPVKFRIEEKSDCATASCAKEFVAMAVSSAKTDMAKACEQEANKTTTGSKLTFQIKGACGPPIPSPLTI